ncbi:unnamed protein product [Allacma fusca]|uniref:Reverse transcriptase Ty1/copia-type domain-containing protein n=1 Tax=Allacma fusca TaxID=39272 RepID=A0A8J2K4S5_9HEXA|nr:unnamed protein product [Allacma fusca]
MATTIRADSVDKLTGNNFNRWKWQISMVLEAADLLEVVDGTQAPPTDQADLKKWKKNDVQARSIIGYPAPEGKVLHLLKSIYGLKQSPRCWHEKFSKFLANSFGLHKSQHDPSIFIGEIQNVFVCLILYVDDGLMMSPKKDVLSSLMDGIQQTFKITKGSPTSYVGLEITRKGETGPISITQKKYIVDLLEKYNMSSCKPASVPLQPDTELTPIEPTDDSYPYRQIIGSLLFLAKCSRPDISVAVSKLAQFLNCYGEPHWKAAKGVLRYLRGTTDVGITYQSSGNMQLVAFTDSDFAGCKITRRSTSGYVVMLNDSIISWCSQKQPCVTLSSTEAEYVAVTTGAKEVMWLRSFLKELGHPQEYATDILVDNQSAIRITKNPEMHGRTKHIDVRHHFIRDLVTNQEVKLEYVPTQDQLADCLTKPLLKGKLHHNRRQLGISEVEGPSSGRRQQPTSNNFVRPLSPLMIIGLIAMFIVSASANAQSPPVLWRKSQFL